MAVNLYECLFLIDPNKASADWDGTTGTIHQTIERHGGEIVDSRPWGEPKLAYPIKKFRKGSYLLVHFRTKSEGIPKMEHDFRLNEALLRHMVIRLHPQIASEILAHLAGGEAPLSDHRPVDRGDDMMMGGGGGGRRDRGERSDRGDRGGDRGGDRDRRAEPAGAKS